MKKIIALAALGLVSACGQEEAREVSAAPSAEEARIQEAALFASGAFEGRSDHVTTGRVSIRRDGETYLVVLEEDFSLDGAPAPTLGFGDGEFIAETEFSSLRSKTGYQTYELPATIDPAEYTQFYVWCADFSVPLGVAALTFAQSE